ncbi:UDP-glycosyltransferase 83A1-like [Euphorbia lathyris]|uniref:UDP-glycosyltransferase 83A1-like n=1 Tax=Euphorbia lathyris TaxID=212925 RepID=UPI0033143E0E
MDRRGHVIVIPYPAQGHVAPLMKFAYKIAENGIKVTFVNADFIHDKIMSSLPHNFKNNIPITLVSISTGLAMAKNRDHEDIIETMKRISSNMPCNLQRLIENINQGNNDEHVSCVVADLTAYWAIEVAEKLGIKRAGFIPFGIGNLALNLHASKLIESGIIDVHGIPFKDELIYVSKEIPPWNSKELTWSMQYGKHLDKFVFKHLILDTVEIVKKSDWILVNSFYELEQSACDLIPDALPIGPLFMHEPFPGNFWQEDSSCLNWLDQQPQGSVIYAAFGSTTVCNQQQFDELAYGLEVIGQPFLWVVRSNFTQGNGVEFPHGFKERVGKYGKIVEWAPQEKVLAHPSIACFFSHCGWNSTLEGVSRGVPYLCWPYFGDQMRNSYYICETWKVGLRIFPDENGIVTRQRVKSKIEKLLSDQHIKANSLKLKDMAAKSMSEGGVSFKNFMSFIGQIKQ